MRRWFARYYTTLVAYACVLVAAWVIHQGLAALLAVLMPLVFLAGRASLRLDIEDGHAAVPTRGTNRLTGSPSA